MIEQLVSRVFYTRDAAHLAHWRTKSFAQHEALGEFYGTIVGDLDAIVEAFQGCFDLIAKVPPRPGPREVDDMVQHLMEEVEWIDENRERISKDFSAIENLVDTLSATYLSALYKLRNLK